MSRHKRAGAARSVIPFPNQNQFARHLEAMQVIALAKPKLAKAMIRLTATCAREITRSKTG